MALSKLAVKRLTKLADYMDSLPKSANKHFDMSSWFGHNGHHAHKELDLSGKYDGVPIGKKELNLCGTTACALGWATTIPQFRSLGLELFHDGGIGEVRFGRIIDGDAAEKFFDIDFDAVDELFGMPTYGKAAKTPKQWAKHCRKFIRENS